MPDGLSDSVLVVMGDCLLVVGECDVVIRADRYGTSRERLQITAWSGLACEIFRVLS